MLQALRASAKVCLQVLIICATAYVGWLVVAKFWAGLFPVIIALILCTVLDAPTSWMRRRGVPAGLAALATILVSFSLVGAVVAVVAPDIARQSQALVLQAVEGIQRLRLWLQGPPINLDSEDFDEAVNEVVSWVQDQAGAIAGGIFTGISTATSVVFTLVVMLVLTFFFLKDGHRFLPWMRRVVGRRQGWHLTELLTRAWSTLSGYIRAQAIVSAVDALFIGAGLYLIGVPMALALALITFAAGFIPIVGAVSAGALAVLIALVSLGVPQALLVLVLIVAVQQLEGNVLSPILQSKAMNLHPVIVLVSVTVGGGLFHIAGAFLAVPVAAMVAVVFRYTQDIMMLCSGESTLDDVAFSTRAGLAVGTVCAAEGEQMRAEMHEAVSIADDGDPSDPIPAAPRPSAQDAKLADAAPGKGRQSRTARARTVGKKIVRRFESWRRS
ncbi:AI-2E family transporter [Corynebacterium atypicum]|uniref:AI-2E family transporter n=1 Tax=Corynebacterium atypicum TaxID=191610 RepID=UPI001F3206B0|nr:AI-2E family transporter [Corynebacterium atypicum]